MSEFLETKESGTTEDNIEYIKIKYLKAHEKSLKNIFLKKAFL